VADINDIIAAIKQGFQDAKDESAQRTTGPVDDKRAQQLTKESDLIKKQLELLKEVKSTQDASQLQTQTRVDLLNQLIKKESELLNAKGVNRDEQLKIIRDLQRQLDAETDRLNLMREINDEISTSTGLYTKVNKETKKIAIALEEGKLGALGMSKAIKGIDSIGQKAIGMLTNALKETITAIDGTTKAFAKATQLGSQYSDNITATYKSLNIYGVTAQEAMEAQMALTKTVTDFTLVSAAQQRRTMDVAATLGELGVSYADFSSGIQVSMKVFGQSMDGATMTARELNATAKELGVVPGELAAQYARAAPQLAKFGNEGIKTFKELARIQKITSMEMDKVLRLTNKFDTFEGAATQAGQLNAALGGNFVNAMDLMMSTDPVERFEMLRDSILDAGLTFDDMSYYQRKFFTEAAGLDDVSDLALLLRGNMDQLPGATRASAEAMIKQREEAQRNMDMMEKLKSVFLELGEAIIPLVEKLNSLLGFLQKSPLLVKTLIASFLAWKVLTAGIAIHNAILTVSFGSLAAAQAASGKSAAKASAKFVMLTLTLAALATFGLLMRSPSLLVAAFVGLAVGVQLAGLASDKAVNQFRRLAPALVGVGFGVLMITGGIAAMAAAFSLLNVSQMIGMGAILITIGAGAYFLAPALAILSPALVGIGIAAMGATPGLLAISLPIAILGGTVALVATGIGRMAEGFGAMFAAMPADKVSALSSLVAGMALGAPFLMLAGVGLSSMAVGMGLLGLSLLAVSTRDLEAIALFASSLASIKVEEIRAVASAIGEVADAMDGIDTNGAFVFSHIMDTASVTAAAIAAMSGTPAPPTAQPAMRTAQGGGQAAEVTVNFTLDNRILDKKIVTIAKNQQEKWAASVRDGTGTPINAPVSG